MNLSIMYGNLTRDAELRKANVGEVPTSVADFTVAVNSGRHNQRTEFVRVSIWRDFAEKMVPYLKKGRPIIVTGEAHPSYYVRRTDNTVVPQLTITQVSQIRLVGNRVNNEGSGEDEVFENPDDAAPENDLPFET